MATVYVNDKPVDIGTEKLNLIQAALKGGVFIPHYCWHPALSVVASCRMCLVEVGEKKPDGTIAMQPKVVPACHTPLNKPDIGEHISLFTDRCIMCSRCVRFTREIAGTAELMVTSRGHHSEIDIFPGDPVNNKLAGNVVDLCPVGALANKDFLYKQ